MSGDTASPSCWHPTRPQPEPCIGTLTGSATVNGTWASDCESTEPSRRDGGDRYARFYTFTLTAASDVTVTLESTEDTFLYLRQGTGKSGTALHTNDDHADEADCTATLTKTEDSCITASLAAGDYTIEATTYESETTGSFTLTVQISGLYRAAARA